MDWITDITMRLATETKLDPADLLVDADDKNTLLDLAGVAAHASGDRTNAPILCHVLGRAIARGATLEECALVIGDFAGDK
ncbi:MAG: hypothetical protein QOI08_1925 [Actinomycetota bacterium]|jgi:hypothetical protein|nr:hypothetical protein [Actinomycetota bacterium]